MRTLFIFLYILSVSLTVSGIVIAARSDNRVALYLRNFSFACLLSISLKFYAFLSPTNYAAHIFHTLSLVSFNLVVMLLFICSWKYARYNRYYPAHLIILSCILTGDAISLIVNALNTPATQYSTVYQLTDAGMYHPIRHNFFLMHQVICILVILYTLFLLARRMYPLPSLYRRQYYILIFISVLLYTANTLFQFLPEIPDFSFLLLGIASIMFTYYMMFHSPRELRERGHSLIIEELTDAILLFDYGNNCIDMNEMAEKFFSMYKLSTESVYHTAEVWLKQYGFDVSTSFMQNVSEQGESGDIRSLRVQCKQLKDQKSNSIGSFIYIHDSTDELRKQQEDLYHATHDELTSVYSRNSFYEEVAKYLFQNPNEKFLMVCSDIENFKIVNDVFGIAVGDQVLCRLVAYINTVFLNNGLVGRLGSDIFAFLIHKGSLADSAFDIFRKKNFHLDGDFVYPLHIYLGVYEITDQTIPISTMCDRALMAIKRSKGNPNLIVSFFDESFREQEILEQQLLLEIETAFRRDEFTFFIQPQVDFENHLVGGEALVRWTHPTKGLVPPSVFIELLEKKNLITRLDMIIWRKVCQTLSRWRKQGIRNLSLSVNISAKDFFYLDIPTILSDLVDEFNIPPKNLRLEITESAIMHSLETQLPIVNKLQKLGFTVEMDDFGSGYSSLNTLKHLEVDVIKLDMGFLDSGLQDRRSKAILENTLDLARKLDMSFIIEGVETKEEAEYLASIGCNHFQGYYFERPMAIEAFEGKYFPLEKP